MSWVEEDIYQKQYYSEVHLNKPKEYFTFYPLAEFPNSIYEINKVGQIRNKNTHKLVNGAIRNGYKTYTLRIDNKVIFRSAHILVAKQFIPNPDNKSIVNHIDENKSNSCVENVLSFYI